MRKLFLVVLVIAAWVSSPAKADNGMMCLKHVEVSIKTLYPPIRLNTDPKRNDKIVLRMPMDCSDGQILKPSTFSEAEDWLDVALPLEFKKGMTGGPYLNPYMYTLYGTSVEDQLYDYFTTQWQLAADAPACKNAPLDKAIDPEGNTCFYQIIDDLRSKYRHPIAVTQ